ncbi:MAG: hypothetical protein ACYDDD_10705 [Acidithiobacillus ferrivorans]
MNPELADIVIVAIETAMRQGEILGLEWRHVHWLDHTDYLPDTKERYGAYCPAVCARGRGLAKATDAGDRQGW